MFKKAPKNSSAFWINFLAYIAITLVIVYTVFLITSYFQLERGLIAEERVVQNIRNIFLEGGDPQEFSTIEETLVDVQIVNRELRLRNALITVGASSILGVILIVILLLFARRTKELYHNRAQTESTLLGIGDGLIVTDEFGQVALVNPAFENMLGWKQDEIKGKEVIGIIHVTDEKGKKMPDGNRLVVETLKEGSRATGTMNYQRRNGTVFPVAVTVAPVVVGDKIVGAVEVFRDITKQKEIDEAKDTFISIASHQLRTPLTSIRWLLETLISGRAGKLKTDQSDILKEAHGSVLRLNALVAELLNVSRIETGRLQVKPVSVDIIELADNVLGELDPELEEKNVSIKKEFSQDIPKIKLDTLIVRQVISNILSNAIKYSYGGGEVIFTIKKDKEFVRLEIKDSGIGIPKKDRDKIFGRFFRASNSGGAREAGGTGLGLFLAKRLVGLSGGEIDFDSEENKGTTFWFTLPLEGSKEREGEVTLSSSSPE